MSHFAKYQKVKHISPAAVHRWKKYFNHPQIDTTPKPIKKQPHKKGPTSAPVQLELF